MRPTTTTVVLAVLCLTSACTGGDVVSGTGGASSGAAPREADGATVEEASNAPEILVENGVAPYDAASAADSEGLEVTISTLISEIVDACVREEGFAIPENPTTPWTREEAVWGFNATFPYVEGLARDGLRVQEAQPTGPDGELPEGMEAPPSGYDGVLRGCLEELPEGDAIHPTAQLKANVRNAWEGVLEEIEATEEIRGLASEFSQCLLTEGMPTDATTDEFAFLFHVDGLKMDAGEDAGRIAELSEQYGKLYVECGRGLFEARERLRGGERRSEFLAEHHEDIQELTELLRSEGVL